MLDGRVLGASQVEYKPFGKPPLNKKSSELDGAGADFFQAFAYEGGVVWDFVYARRLLSKL